MKSNYFTNYRKSKTVVIDRHKKYIGVKQGNVGEKKQEDIIA